MSSRFTRARCSKCGIFVNIVCRGLFKEENMPLDDYEPCESVRILREDIGGMDQLFKKLRSHPNAGIPASEMDLKMRLKL